MKSSFALLSAILAASLGTAVQGQDVTWESLCTYAVATGVNYGCFESVHGGTTIYSHTGDSKIIAKAGDPTSTYAMLSSSKLSYVDID